MFRHWLSAATALLVVGGPAALAEPAAPPPGPPGPASGNAAPPPSAPQGGATPRPARSERDREVEELKRIIEELRRRVEELERQRAPQPPAPQPPAPQPPAPETPAPDTPVPEPVPPTGPTGAPTATLLPNISVLGNLIFSAGDTRATPARGRFRFDELELAFQDQVTPKLRYDLFINAEQEEEWRVGMEEGFLTGTAILPRVNARIGRIRTPIGKFNPLHPHQWVFITRPAAHRYLLGDHGLTADGALVEYLLPLRDFYGSIQVGRWATTGIHHHEENEDVHAHRRRGVRRAGEKEPDDDHDHDDDHEEHEGLELPDELGFVGGESGAYSARLSFARALGRDRELEFGVSRYWGRGEVETFGRRLLAVNGLDVTFRSYPRAFQRLLVQAELLAHETHGIRGETKIRPGAYLLVANRWNQYWEGGLRLDYSRLPFPFPGQEYGASLFLTRFLTEQNSLRLEYRWARDPRFGAGNALFFQVLFGSGPHAHPLQ